MGEHSVCASIGTLNDLLYEEDETFTVFLTSLNPSVNIGVSSTIVDIRDNDGGLFIFNPSFREDNCNIKTIRQVLLSAGSCHSTPPVKAESSVCVLSSKNRLRNNSQSI